LEENSEESLELVRARGFDIAQIGFLIRVPFNPSTPVNFEIPQLIASEREKQQNCEIQYLLPEIFLQYLLNQLKIPSLVSVF
jgi:hypothetical protein